VTAVPGGPADAADELPHRGTGDARWHEVFDLVFWSPRATFGGHLTVVLWPSLARAWYWTSVVQEGRPPVALLDTDVALPGRGLELRASGLWADHNCETPYEHWSYGLEAFAVRLDEPEDALADFRGERTPLGYDVEWEADDRDPSPRPLASDAATAATAATAVTRGYRQAGRVHGEVLVGLDAYDLDGHGVRFHRWGTAWWPSPDGPTGRGSAADSGGDVIGRSMARLPVPGGDRLVRRTLWRTAAGGAWSDAVSAP
jgi:hypothetical protein